MTSALSRIRTLLPLRTGIAYSELPSHPLSQNGTPYSDSAFSPALLSPAWRKSSSRRRRFSLPRVLPLRFVVAICSCLVIVLVAGGHRYRQHRKEEEARLAAEAEARKYDWERFPRLNGFYDGVRSLVPFANWTTEQQATKDTTFTIYDSPPLKPIRVDPYPFSTAEYLEAHYPVQECFLDENETVPAPDVFAYPGVPANMTAPYWGSYEALGMAEDRCWERFGRMGPYGYSYNPAEGGLGLANHSTRAGTEDIERLYNKVDYRKVKWGQAQQRCYEKNKYRFDANTTAPGGGAETRPKKTLKRTAYVLRTWAGYHYDDIQLLSLRAMINELSLKSGGEYDMHLLVHVKDDTIPIWASKDIYRKTLEKNVPEEFWDIATLWSEQQMRTYYPGPFPDKDNFHNHANADIYGVYRTAHFALQWFAQQHPEYDFFWNWEMDVRYSGHYYEFHNAVAQWAAKQPRKLLWERSSKFWIPAIHGPWHQFSNMVEREVVQEQKLPIWGPVSFPVSGLGMLPTPNTTVPPTNVLDDDYEWGVGDEADLIVFDPLFDPAQTNWVFRDDVTGYNTSLPEPPRRAAIITISRLSRDLLDTMHEETFRMRHTMFPEMWPPTVALHHGYKAVYAPHPVYFDRKWPLQYMDQIFNHPRKLEASPFGWGEHNMQGSSFYYNAGFSGALWRRWLGAVENGEGGMKNEEKGSGRMCLRGMLFHPIKSERVA